MLIFTICSQYRCASMFYLVLVNHLFLHYHSTSDIIVVKFYLNGITFIISIWKSLGKSFSMLIPSHCIIWIILSFSIVSCQLKITIHPMCHVFSFIVHLLIGTLKINVIFIHDHSSYSVCSQSLIFALLL